MPTYSNWTSTTTPISYVPKEKPVYETVGLFTSSTQGIVPPTQNESTNTGQYILAQDGTWIPQPSFSSGGSNAYEILRPAVLGTTYSAYPPTVTNTAYAYDADINHATTFAEFECASQTRINAITDTLTYSTFASRAQTWTAATINVSRAYGYFDDGESNATTGASNRNTSVTIEYSINNGTNWFTLATDISTSIPSTATSSSAALSTTTPTMANILVKLTLVRGGGGQIYDPDTSANLPGSTGDIDLKLYDIWISGTYTSGAGNITCNDLLVTGDATLQNKLYDGSGSAGTAGYILSSTGTKTAWVPDSVGSGTVTSITTTGANGVTISGGSTQTITTSGTFALALGAITPTSIATGTGSFSGDVEFASSIKSPNSSNSPVTIAPDGTGDVHLNTDSVRIGDNNADATIATRGTGDLIITTNEGSAVEGIVRLYDGANGNITLTPNGSGQVKVGTDQVATLVASQTLTNKTISGSSNTLSNIANASLTNSTISGVALGSNLNALTISSPLTGTSYNGSSAVSIGIPVATASADGYLSSANWTTFNNKGSGSVTSVAATVPSLLSISGSPITTSGTLAITYSGTALPVANGGTGLTTLTAGYIPYGAGTSAFGSSANLFWDSANSRLGIGTTSPSYTLEVYKPSSTANLAVTSASTGTADFSDFRVIGNDVTARISAYGSNHTSRGSQVWVNANTNTPLILATNNTERVRIDVSGNVGIGVTPSAWYTGGSLKALQIGANAAIISLFGTRSVFASNYYLASGTGTDTYIANGFASQYYQESGTHQWYTAASGTAGNAISFSERMRIDNSGNVGIGTASPYQAKLDVSGVGGTGSVANIGASNSSFDQLLIGSINRGSSPAFFSLPTGSAFIGAIGNGLANTLGIGTYGAAPVIFGTSNTERMRIDSSGNVGIGTASPSQKLTLGGQTGASATPLALQFSADWSDGYVASKSKIYLYNNGGSGVWGFAVGPDNDIQYHSGGATNTNGQHKWYSGNVEFMRLNASGNLGIGTASPASRLHVYTAGTNKLTLDSPAANENRLDFAKVGTVKWSMYSPASSNDLRMYDHQTVGDVVTFASGGNVGIGTASPSAKLHVSGNTISSNFYIPAGSAGTYGLADLSSAIQTYSGSVSPVNSMLFYSNGSERMRIDTTQVKATVPFIGNSGTKGFGAVTTTTSTSTPTGGSSGDHYYIY